MKGNRIPKAKARGQRGWWFAEVNGEALPCVHAYWFKKGWYHDPHARPGDPQWDELIAAIKEKKRVVLTNDNESEDGMRFERTGYVAVYSVDHVAVEGADLRFRFIERLIELE